MVATPPPSASRYYAASALVATKAASEATAVRPKGIRAAWSVVMKAQIQQATIASSAVEAMLDQQDIEAKAEALLNTPAFVTSAARFEQMAEQAKMDNEFERLVESIVQDAARAAQEVEIVARPGIAFVRHLNLPSCGRCAVLAGRVYKWSQSFLRHPGCDCVMIPTTVANDRLTYDPVQLAREGQIRGLSKADMSNLESGADFNKVVNTKQRRAGLMRPGDTIGQAGQQSIDDAIANNKTRVDALYALIQAAYVR